MANDAVREERKNECGIMCGWWVGFVGSRSAESLPVLRLRGGGHDGVWISWPMRRVLVFFR